MVPMIGMLGYLLPIPALWVAYQFVRQPEDIRRFLMIYVVCAFAFKICDCQLPRRSSELFGQVGGARWLYVPRTRWRCRPILPGYLRSPEVAAWHAAALACLFRWSWRFPSTAGNARTVSFHRGVRFYTILLTGRRKALAIMVIFAGIYPLV